MIVLPPYCFHKKMADALEARETKRASLLNSSFYRGTQLAFSRLWENACGGGFIFGGNDMGLRIRACVVVLLLTASGAFGEKRGDHDGPITIRTGNWG
jgi:hypothetical protein